MSNEALSAGGGAVHKLSAVKQMKQKSATKVQRTPGTPGSYVLDRLIVPRIENFAQNNDYTDVDAVAGYLRSVYREYQRHKLGPFRSQVAQAVQFIQQRGGVSKQEIQLQVRLPRLLS